MRGWIRHCVGIASVLKFPVQAFQSMTGLKSCLTTYSLCDLRQVTWGFPGGSVKKNSTCPCTRCQRCDSEKNSWVGKIPWRRKWQPPPVFLPGKFPGQRSLAGYSPWGHKELDTTERLSTHNTGKLLTSGGNFSFFICKMGVVITTVTYPLGASLRIKLN